MVEEVVINFPLGSINRCTTLDLASLLIPMVVDGMELMVSTVDVPSSGDVSFEVLV